MKDGGPAFPLPGDQFEEGTRVARSFDAPGMSLRDYFAAQALSAVIERYGDGFANIAHKSTLPLAESMAVVAYEYADAMLRAREKGAPA